MRKKFKLWFAFEIYIFDILIQQKSTIQFWRRSCDLLSKFISLIFWYNINRNFRIKVSLWFAFEIYIFDILIQQSVDGLSIKEGCDLLSKFISLIFWYNRAQRQWSGYRLWFAFEIYIFDILIQLGIYDEKAMNVVICFRNLYLWYSDTTSCRITLLYLRLWFAFEIYIFDILIQLRLSGYLCTISCDLLSKFISLIFWYNSGNAVSATKLVVICFRNLYLWYSDTTNFLESLPVGRLWFAFEIYIFDILIQHRRYRRK